MYLRLIMAGALALAGVVAHAATVTVVEYYNASLGHYFMTPRSNEIELLDTHQFPGWVRTGLAFDAYNPASHPPSAVQICRMYNDKYNGTSSHFYGTLHGDCAVTQQLFPDWTFEDPELFDADVGNAAGTCPIGEYPVFRVFNNGMGGAPNHRFTNSPEVVQRMVAKGYASEGPAWCTTSLPPAVIPPPPEASAAGVWTGTTSAGEAALAMVLDDGTFYIEMLKAGQTIESDVVYGTAETTDGRFDSAATDSPIADAAETRGVARAIAVSGTFTEGGTLHVTMAGTSGGRTLDATYAPGAVSAASLATLAGGYAGYTGHADGRQGAGVTIQADGSFSGGNGACSFAGAFTPRGDAPVFTWTIHATAGTTCRFGAGPITGLAFLSADGRKLSAYAPFPTGETDAYFMIVTRP